VACQDLAQHAFRGPTGRWVTTTNAIPMPTVIGSNSATSASIPPAEAPDRPDDREGLARGQNNASGLSAAKRGAAGFFLNDPSGPRA